MTNNFYCTCCGEKGIPIFRKGNQRREKGHLKKLYCLKCKKETNHVEIGNGYTYENFLTEYNNNNFDEEGNRKVPVTQFLKGK